MQWREGGVGCGMRRTGLFEAILNLWVANSQLRCDRRPESRVMRHLVIKLEPAERAVRQMQLDLLRQPPLRLTTGRKTGTIHQFSVFVSTRFLPDNRDMA
jgi:hypothetical protein